MADSTIGKPVDTVQLLRKYMEHVYKREGVDFTAEMYRALSERDGVVFTDAEWAQLNEVSSQIQMDERAYWNRLSLGTRDLSVKS